MVSVVLNSLIRRNVQSLVFLLLYSLGNYNWQRATHKNRGWVNFFFQRIKLSLWYLPKWIILRITNNIINLLILDVLNKIKAGLQYASNYLQTAKDIANLVSKSLGHKQNQKRGEDGGNDEKQQQFGPSNFVSAFFRLIGFDSQKITAIAVNSVIFLAQMVSIWSDIYYKLIKLYR